MKFTVLVEDDLFVIFYKLSPQDKILFDVDDAEYWAKSTPDPSRVGAIIKECKNQMEERCKAFKK